jgi:hypothetical protein
LHNNFKQTPMIQHLLRPFRKKKVEPQVVSAFDTIKRNMKVPYSSLISIDDHVNNGKQQEVVDVTILINVWKRNHLEEQLFHLLTQSVIPKEIWVLHYEDHIKTADIISIYKEHFPFIQLIKSDKNLKYFGRFSIAVNVTTTYTWIIDDDVIPGEQWLENCVKKCSSLNAIICCTGRLIPKNDYQPEISLLGTHFQNFVGDRLPGKQMNYCEADTKVDYGCNSYFFKTAWMQAYWSIWPATFLSGEDIHLSATCKTVLNVDTYVPEQLNGKDSGNIKRPYGWDHNASWKQGGFIKLRAEVLKYHIHKKNWMPILWQ